MALRVSEDEWETLRARTGAARSDEEQVVTRKPSKYRNKKVTVGDMTFDSKAEAARYIELVNLSKAGKIEFLRRQRKFPIEINGYHVCNYIADFDYMEDGTVVVEDVKGVATPVYRLKKKLVEALYPVRIKEVKAR